MPEYKVSTLYSGTGTMHEFGYVHISVHRVPYSATLPGNKGTRGGDSAYESGGMLVVSLRGVNFGFWSHLGCSGQNAIIFSREGLV